jgi:hypothetical protein
MMADDECPGCGLPSDRGHAPLSGCPVVAELEPPDVDDGCYDAGATDTPGLHRPDCNAIRNGGPCDQGRGAVSQ